MRTVTTDGTKKGSDSFVRRRSGFPYSTIAVEANMCRAPKPWDGARTKTEQACIPALGSLEESGEGEVDAYKEQQQGSISLETHAAFAFTGPPTTPRVAIICSLTQDILRISASSSTAAST